MKAGQFNIYEYLEKLTESAESGNLSSADNEGIIIPDENKKSYDWLKKEYNAKQTEVKVEISGQGASFKPGYDLQTNLDSVKDFKPGMFGEAKPAKDGAAPEQNAGKKANLDPKKDAASFSDTEGESEKKELPKTNSAKGDINNKQKSSDDNSEKKEEKPEEKKSEKPEEKPEEKKGEKPEVKKIDLKTKKQ